MGALGSPQSRRRVAGALPLADAVLRRLGAAGLRDGLCLRPAGCPRPRRLRAPPGVHDGLRPPVHLPHERVGDEIWRHNTDLQELFDFGGGLAARAHDSAALSAYAETRLSAVLGAEVHITRDPAAGSIPLLCRGLNKCRMAGALIGARRVTSSGSASATRSSPSSRRRSRAPRPATGAGALAIDRRALAEHGGEGLLHRRAHRAGRRVAVALAKRLGYAGAELDGDRDRRARCTTSARSGSRSGSSTSPAR